MTQRLEDPEMQRLKRCLVIGAFVFAGMLVLGYVVFVLTGWGQQQDAAAYGGRRAMARLMRWRSSDLLDLVQVSTIALVGLALMIVATVRGRARAGLVIGLGWAAAILIAECCKWSLPRPLLLDDAHGPNRQSYPSGHATIATSAALAMVLLVPARWRQWTATAAGLASATYSGGVVFTGMHRSSDALGAIMLSTAAMSAAAAVLAHLWGRRPRAARVARAPLLTSGVLALALAAGWSVLASRSTGTASLGRAELLVFAAAISVAAFSATAWFGASTSQFDWPRETTAAPPR